MLIKFDNLFSFYKKNVYNEKNIFYKKISSLKSFLRQKLFSSSKKV